ncbi:hypothetical protein EON65_33335 [archaeon]|nr:MAG: hypothetical protein EON65_33335 [archaeon]
MFCNVHVHMYLYLHMYKIYRVIYFPNLLFIAELLEGRSYNKSVDVYAFGVLLCELLTGEIPFGRTEINELRQRVLAGKRPTIPAYGISSRVLRLINKCW